MATASSVTRHNITWTFDTTYTVGQYANGDYYVVENSPGVGVTINSTTPAYTLEGGTWHKNGSMINPVAGQSAGQGFDSSTYSWSAGLNVGDDLPLSVAAGSSFCTASSKSTEDNRPQLQDFAVLTVVASAPAANSFRPPYCGTDKTVRGTVSDLDYSVLQSLDLPNSGTNVPDLSVSEGRFARTWYEIQTQWVQQHLHPSGNMPSYGREMHRQIAQAMLHLQLNYSNATKETLMIRLVQYGIDLFGAAKSGAVWQNNGGHNSGRKSALLLAAVALDDSEILAYGDKEQHFIFGEDQQTFVVSQTEVDVTNSENWDPDTRGAIAPYVSGDIGTPDWGIEHKTYNRKDNAAWGSIYRTVSFACNVGSCLAVNMMGIRSLWNWEPYFDYIDRYWSIEEVHRANSANKINLFEADMWDAYRYIGPPDPATKIAAATADLSGGTYDSTQGLTFTEAVGTTTYYTTDGSEPSDLSTEYTGSISISSTTTVRWITYDDTATLLPSELQLSTFTIACATPAISPNGGEFSEVTSVAITTSTAGASIYYTTDGTTPDNTDTLYSGAFEISATTTINAIAIKSGLSDSAIQSALFDLSVFYTVPSGQWINASIPSETGTFSYQFTAIPDSLGIDVVMAFSESTIDNPVENSDFDNLATSIRFFTNGEIEVRNGGTYTNDIAITYVANMEYVFEIEVNIAAHTYTVKCTPSGSSTSIIAEDYAFRTEQAAVSTLANFALLAEEDQDLTDGDGVIITKFFKVEPVTPIRGDKALIEMIL